MRLTADMVYEVAYSLKPDSFICCNFSDRFGKGLRRDEFEPLLKDCGVDLSGAWGMKENPDASDREIRWAERFMLCEFVALYLETGR